MISSPIELSDIKWMVFGSNTVSGISSEIVEYREAFKTTPELLLFTENQLCCLIKEVTVSRTITGEIDRIFGIKFDTIPDGWLFNTSNP